MRRKKKRNLDYKADLLADLRENAEFAAEYLSAAYADSRGAFLVAMRDVVEARKGIANIASQANVNRESLYRALSEAGNPTIATLASVWSALRFKVRFEVEPSKPISPPANAQMPIAASAQIKGKRIITTTGNITASFATWTALGSATNCNETLPMHPALPESHVPLYLLGQTTNTEARIQQEGR